jgi:hypothetical protein
MTLSRSPQGFGRIVPPDAIHVRSSVAQLVSAEGREGRG